MKTYGKQTIFVYNQVSCVFPVVLTKAQLPVLDPEELGRIDESLKTAKESVEDKRKQLKVLSSGSSYTPTLTQTWLRKSRSRGRPSWVLRLSASTQR